MALVASVPKHVRFWSIADISFCTASVRFWRQSGHDNHCEMSARDPKRTLLAARFRGHNLPAISVLQIKRDAIEVLAQRKRYAPRSNLLDVQTTLVSSLPVVLFQTTSGLLAVTARPPCFGIVHHLKGRTK